MHNGGAPILQATVSHRRQLKPLMKLVFLRCLILSMMTDRNSASMTPTHSDTFRHIPAWHWWPALCQCHKTSMAITMSLTYLDSQNCIAFTFYSDPPCHSRMCPIMDSGIETVQWHHKQRHYESSRRDAISARLKWGFAKKQKARTRIRTTHTHQTSPILKGPIIP